MDFDLSRLGDWSSLPFFNDTLPSISATLEGDSRTILPPATQVFAALERTQPEAVKAVILGQDPYPTPGHAHGLAFSVEPDVRPLPRSLNNIFKELAEDLDLHPTNGDLRPWADQGVLLLNSALTVPAGEAGAHAKLGWSLLVEQVLQRLDDHPRACLLWGKHAQKLGAHLHNPDHLRIETAHPSPLSARRGFFGSRPFSLVNDWLIARGDTPIDWTGTS